jgi:hypothetical protein
MSRADVVPIAEARTKRHSYPPLTICDTHGWGYFTSLWPPSELRGPKSTRVMPIRLVFVLMERATLTSRVHGARMCLTIKLFWVKSALISFHNISVLQGGRLSQSGVLKLLVSNTLVLWRGILPGLAILICRASSRRSRNRTAHIWLSGAIG